MAETPKRGRKLAAAEPARRGRSPRPQRSGSKLAAEAPRRRSGGKRFVKADPTTWPENR